MVEMQDLFSLEHVGKSPSKFNLDKLLHLNAHYIKMAEPSLLADLLVPSWRNAGSTRNLLRGSHPSSGRCWSGPAPSRRWPNPRNTTSARSRPIRKRRRSSSPRRSPLFSSRSRMRFSASRLQGGDGGCAESGGGTRRGNLKVHQPIRVALTGGTASRGCSR